MVCINHRISEANVVLSAGDVCEIPPQPAHPSLDDLPTEYYEYDGSNLDTEGGPYTTRTRHYDPTEGRWFNEDPISFEGGDPHRYPGNATGVAWDTGGMWPRGQ